VLLLDEIEKAHPDLYNILLQVMDHGKLTDHNGKPIDFRNVILIMTTNAGASEMAKPPMGFERGRRQGEDAEAVNRLFTPEFRNRLDAVIPFGGLPPEVIARVVDKFIFQLEAQLSERSVTIELTDAARKWIGEIGYDEKFGARPLGRVIQEHIKKPLADELLFGKLEHGGAVKIDLEGKGLEKHLTFDFIPAEPGSAKTDAASEDDEEPETALVDVAPRKALPGPKEKKEKGTRPSGSVPGVPRKKDD
jgi:ATP-dependent Clp protease ATP-binding subunit ClpA